MDMKKLLSIVDGQSTKTSSASAAGDMKKFMSIVKESAINSYVEKVQEDRTETASLKKQLIDEEVTEKAKRVADKLKEKYGLTEAKKPSAGMTKKEKSAVVKKAKAGKDQESLAEAGLDMNLIKAASEKGMGARKSDPESDRNIKKPYGYRSDKAMDDDDDDDEPKAKKRKAKKKVSESLNEEGMQQLMPKITQAKKLLAKMPESQSKAKAQEHIAAAEENINAGNSFKALYHIAQFSRYAGTTESQVIESINIEAMKHYLSRLDERVSIGPDGKITGGIKPTNTNTAEVTPIKSTQSTVGKYTPGVTYPAAYTISYNGKEYKFAGRDKDAPGTGEKIVVGAGAIGIRGLAPTTIELGNDGMYYHAGR